MKTDEEKHGLAGERVGYTPGPWTVDEPAGDYAGVAEAIESDERVIAWTADSWGIDGLGAISEEDKANARLIAAAPDLLSALEHALSEYEVQLQIEADDNPTVEKMRAAIAKATGGVKE